METYGILFIATGEKYVRAGIRATHSILSHCPDLPIHLFTDTKSFNTIFEKSILPFTSIGEIKNSHFRSKVDYLSRTPFDRTLYLDTDTALNGDIRSIFNILDRFDVALTHAHHRNSKERLTTWRIELTQAFPQFNGGVILYRKAPDIIKFLEDWSSYYKEAGFRHDQTTLRELLWLSNLRIATLPPEYNVRDLKYHFLWSKSEAVTKIFHLKQLHKGWLQWLFRRPIRIARKIIRKLRPN